MKIVEANPVTLSLARPTSTLHQEHSCDCNTVQQRAGRIIIFLSNGWSTTADPALLLVNINNRIEQLSVSTSIPAPNIRSAWVTEFFVVDIAIFFGTEGLLLIL